MTTTRKPTGRTRSMPVGLTLGAAVALALTLTLSLIGAKLIDMGKIKEQQIGYLAMGILMLSAFLGALVACGAIRRRKGMVCALSALIYYCLLLSITALFFGGQYQGMGVTALVVLCGDALALLLTTRQGRGAGQSRRRHGHR